jgi:hypothetical protein
MAIGARKKSCMQQNPLYLRIEVDGGKKTIKEI